MANIKLPAKVTRACGKVALKTQKNAPEILLVTGVVTFLATIVVACKETCKAADVVENFKEDIDDIKKAKQLHDCGGVIEEDEDGNVIRSAAADSYDDNEYRKDMIGAYARLGWGLTKTYAPAALLCTLSIASFLTSHGILKKRELAAVATSAALRQALDEYRTRVRKEVGDEVEHRIYHGVEDKTLAIADDDGHFDKEVKYTKMTHGSVYSRFYDESAKDFSKSGSANYSALVSDMKYLNYKLIAEGHLFLNDVYKQLGFPITCAGQSAGWIYDPKDPQNTMLKFVGMEDIEFTSQGTIIINTLSVSDDWKALMNDYERCILLDFVNIRDDILMDLPRVDSEVAVV